MKYNWKLLLGLCFLTSMVGATPITEGALTRRVQEAGTPFRHMRFYPPSMHVYTQPGVWDRLFYLDTSREHERALAFYLFNMYVISRAQALPLSQLSLNELGVLDAFMLCHEPFPFQEASLFLDKHRPQVTQWLEQFTQTRKMPGKLPTWQEYQHWARLLETLPLHQKQAVYNKPSAGPIQPISLGEVQLLRAIAQQAQAVARNLVVLYDEPKLELEDLDHKIGNTHAHRQRTYRWAAEECYYSSYAVGKILSEDFVQHPRTWKDLRIYTLTAYPKQGEFLKPSAADRFQRADGKMGAPWRYHTALLVVLPNKRGYSPVVVDLLLEGGRPVPLVKWTEKFGEDTVFTAVPFRRSETTEKALITPDKHTGSAIWVAGQKYVPAPVLDENKLP